MAKKLSRPRVTRDHEQKPDWFAQRVTGMIEDLRRSARRGDLDLAVVRRGRYGYRVVAVIPRRRRRAA